MNVANSIKVATKCLVLIQGTEYWVTISKKEATDFIAQRGEGRFELDLRTYKDGEVNLFIEAREVA